MEAALYRAVDKNWVRQVRVILQNSPNVNVNWRNPEDSDFTALHLACHENRAAIITILLAHPNIDVNARSCANSPPLYYACREGNIEAVRLLLKKPDLDLNTRNNAGHSALWAAASFGHIAVLKWIIALRGNQLQADDLARQGAEYYQFFDAAWLLQEFGEDPIRTIRALRGERFFWNQAIAQVNALFEAHPELEVCQMLLAYCRLEIQDSIRACKAEYKSSRFHVNIFDFVDWRTDGGDPHEDRQIFTNRAAFCSYTRKKTFPLKKAKTDHLRIMLEGLF